MLLYHDFDPYRVRKSIKSIFLEIQKKSYADIFWMETLRLIWVTQVRSSPLDVQGVKRKINRVLNWQSYFE